MSDKILVAYASRTGSTIGVAATIGNVLAASGARVEVHPIQDVKDIKPYRAVIVGSAIQTGKWLPEAMEFVHNYQAELKQKSFAAFLVCMTMSMKPAYFRGTVKHWLDPVRELVKPVSEGYFAGIIDLDKMPPAFRASRFFQFAVALGMFSEGDHRDWNAIRAWASELPAKLH